VIKLVTPLGVVGLIAVMYLLYIFANLSQRLGAVTKMKPYYRGFYVAMGFLSLSVVARIVLSNLATAPPLSGSLLTSPLFALIVFHIPFIIAAALSVGVAWRYWSWLFKEKLT
jgi:hypothetical protein